MPIVGLDLGSHNFRAVELERRKNSFVLNKFGQYDNPKLNLQSEEKSDLDTYSTALKDFFDEIGFSTPEVVVSLNEVNVYMRTITIPEMSDSDLKNSINFEAEQYIPLPISEVNLSYQKLESDVSPEGKMNVQIVAAKKAILDKYVEILKNSRILPRAIEPETIALGRVLGDNKENPLGTIILDMGYQRTLIIIVYYGFVRFTRSIAIGGDVISRAIQQGLNLDYGQADEYKKVYGIDQNQVDGKIYEIARPIIDNVLTEVKRAGLFFTKQNPGANMKRVILTGGTALMPGMLSYMASNLDMEVELANPLKYVELSGKLEDQRAVFMEQGPIFSTPIGLALKEV
jgi:type IV pilus assembly protein PilM